MKGQLNIQFNWIFVLIVGVSILAMLIAFTFNFSDSAETQVSVQLATQYETIFTSTLQQPGTGKEFSSPNIELEFVCEAEENVHYYAINGITAKDTPYDLIASTDRLSTTRMQTWALEWYAPFPVDTFLYVTSPQQEIIFYEPGNSRRLQILLDLFPENFSHRVVNSSFMNAPTLASNRESYTFILFQDELTAPTDLPDPEELMQVPVERTQVIIIQAAQNTLLEYGALLFLDGESYREYYNDELITSEILSRTERYLGQASLFASFFANTQEWYSCLMQKAFQRLEMTSQLLYYQAESLENSVDQLCYNLLIGDDSDPILYGIKYEAEALRLEAEKGYSVQSLNRAWSMYQNLQQKQARIATLRFCPLLY